MRQQTFEIYATKQLVREEPIEATDRVAAVNAFRAKHPGYQIDYVGDSLLVGYSEASDTPIFEDDDYVVDNDGIYLLRSEISEDDVATPRG